MSRHSSYTGAFVILAGLFSFVGLGAQTTPPIFTALHGTWSGTGELFNRPASFTMTWDVSEDGVAVLTFANAMTNDDGSATPVLTARAIYQADPDSIRGVWLDSRSERLELSATATSSALTTIWKSSSERGRTEYVMQPDGTVEVLDHVETADGWRHFGTARYERLDAVPPGSQ